MLRTTSRRTERTTFATLCLPLLLSASFAVHADYLSMSGAQLYGRFCASCHGGAGHGDGPVAKSITVEVPDITLIARRHAGTFPRERVEKIVDGRFVMAAHGTRTMPIWGEDLSHSELGNPDAERAAQLVIARLVDYLQNLQRPAVPRKQRD